MIEVHVPCVPAEALGAFYGTPWLGRFTLDNGRVVTGMAFEPRLVPESEAQALSHHDSEVARRLALHTAHEEQEAKVRAKAEATRAEEAAEAERQRLETQALEERFGLKEWQRLMAPAKFAHRLALIFDKRDAGVAAELRALADECTASEPPVPRTEWRK